MVLSKDKMIFNIVSYIKKLSPKEKHSIAIYKAIFFLLTENNTIQNYTENSNGIHFDLENIALSTIKSIQKYIDNMNELLTQQNSYEKERELAMENFEKNSKKPFDDSFESNIREAIENIEETDILDFEEEIKEGFKKRHFSIKKEFQKYKKGSKKSIDTVSDITSIVSSQNELDDYNNYSYEGFDSDNDLFGED